MERIVVASNNRGKIREIQELLAPLHREVVAQSDLSVQEALEPHCTFVENALEKARNASRISGLPALADDSGLCVEALGGAPGVRSSRFSGEPQSDERNNRRLLELLANRSDRLAHYCCVLVLLRDPDDPRPIIAEGTWHGLIAREPKGGGGFGYDPLFWVPKHGKTAAELTLAQKNRMSHRGKALRELLRKLACESACAIG
jgi:XTP/dITP diphosphohydrolase